MITSNKMLQMNIYKNKLIFKMNQLNKSQIQLINEKQIDTMKFIIQNHIFQTLQNGFKTILNACIICKEFLNLQKIKIILKVNKSMIKK